LRTARVVIPYKPRDIFLPFHARTQRWSVGVDHRRCGKTVSRVNDLIRKALTCERPRPRFAYIAPLLRQAKDVAWDYLKTFSAPLLPYGARYHETELRADYPNGAQVRLYGADNPDALRGLYLDGVVLDEFGDMDPQIWPVLRPALSDRMGWADFIGTPKGKNEFWRIWTEAQDNDEWFAAMHKAGETGLIPAHELAAARKSLTKDQYAQEYECSFEAAVQGAYYGEDMQAAEEEGRVRHVPYDKAVPVTTAWDLGIGDSTAIVFAQLVGSEIHIIDHLEASGVGLDYYAREIKSRPYVYAEPILPHDARAQELGSGKTRVETLENLGIQVTIAPRLGVDDGINAVRMMLGRVYFNAVKCKRLVEALKQYRRAFDPQAKVFAPKPLHDWTSHSADAMRYLAVGLRTHTSNWTDAVMNFEVDWAL